MPPLSLRGWHNERLTSWLIRFPRPKITCRHAPRRRPHGLRWDCSAWSLSGGWVWTPLSAAHCASGQAPPHGRMDSPSRRRESSGWDRGTSGSRKSRSRPDEGSFQAASLPKVSNARSPHRGAFSGGQRMRPPGFFKTSASQGQPCLRIAAGRPPLMLARQRERPPCISRRPCFSPPPFPAARQPSW